MKSLFFPLLCVAVLVVSSCKDSEADKDRETASAEDVARISSFEGDVFLQLHLLADTLTQVNKISACAPLVTVSGTSYPKTVTIDFGSTPCVGPDGVKRIGVITAVFSGKYKDSLSTVSISTSNYYYDYNRVQMTRTLTNKGRNTAGNIVMQEISTVTVTLTNEKTITYSSNFEKEWSSGFLTTGNLADDVFSITGSASGVGSRGNGFEFKISDALKAGPACRYVTSGKVLLTPTNRLTRTLDFGSGGCDSKLEVDINGYKAEVSIP